ncbi:MAG TPA: rRNA maturation RNase YbeY [Phycisphaerae bacterium]|nr:rRNA maturation RNase YbeY [Phycisphaerae bacterium]
MAKIEITDLQDHIPLERKLILQIFRLAMKEEGRAARSLSVVLTDNRHIRDLSREYLGHDAHTDVLSFPLEDVDWPAMAANGGVNGEIIASAEMALQQAKARNIDPRAELLLYLVHGLLHLIGYDDRTLAQAQRMHQREDELLDHCGFGNVYTGHPGIQ